MPKQPLKENEEEEKEFIKNDLKIRNLAGSVVNHGFWRADSYNRLVGT